MNNLIYLILVILGVFLVLRKRLSKKNTKIFFVVSISLVILYSTCFTKMSEGYKIQIDERKVVLEDPIKMLAANAPVVVKVDDPSLLQL